MDIRLLLEEAIQRKASDLHLSVGLSPYFRIDGDIVKTDYPILTEIIVLEFINALMSDEQIIEFENKYELDLAIDLANIARFRVNIFRQNRGLAAVFRVIPNKVPTMNEFLIPPVFEQIASLQKGLVLVTGSTGSGKSTTLAAMINYLNQTTQQHIVTIEDPIEFIYQSDKCLINQREVYKDTLSFNNALKSALREDPDIILVGELRDIETIRLALTAAETGHLVFATLHTSSASKTVDRLIDAFPGDEKSLVRSILSESLKAIVSQKLLKKEGGGRIALWEILLVTQAIKNLIKEDKTAQIYSAIQTGQRFGMQTFEQHLNTLLVNKMISRETLLNESRDRIE